MDFFVDILTDAALDTLRLIPFLFLTYLAMEAIEHKAEGKRKSGLSELGQVVLLLALFWGRFPNVVFLPQRQRSMRVA